jgi:HAD superfamily hydrolase (TIGR01509 family)
MKVKWVLCDYGGVLADDHIEKSETMLADLFGCSREALRQVTTERSPTGRAIRLDLSSERDFWKSVAVAVSGTPVLPADASKLTALWSSTYAIRKDVAGLIVALESQGVRTGIATNIDKYREKHMRSITLPVLGNLPIFGSWRLGCMKPEARYFEAVTAELGLLEASASILFFDDQQVHVDAATSAGWIAFRYTTVDDMRAQTFNLLEK